MYNETYEEYMRSILGYPVNQCNTYEATNLSYQPTVSMNRQNHQEMEECYPEIYKIVYPMVCKVCEQNTKPVTQELIESLTNEIYFAIETNESVNINVTNTTKKVESKTMTQNRASLREETKEMKEDRHSNFLLNDLIRILIIREILNRPGNRPPRPPFPGPGMPPPHRPPIRPPFPGGHGPKPPIMPRDFDENFSNYVSF